MSQHVLIQLGEKTRIQACTKTGSVIQQRKGFVWVWRHALQVGRNRSRRRQRPCERHRL